MHTCQHSFCRTKGRNSHQKSSQKIQRLQKSKSTMLPQNLHRQSGYWKGRKPLQNDSCKFDIKRRSMCRKEVQIAVMNTLENVIDLKIGIKTKWNITLIWTFQINYKNKLSARDRKQHQYAVSQIQELL